MLSFGREVVHASRVSLPLLLLPCLSTDLFTGTGARRRTLGQVIFNYSNRAPTFSILFPFTPFSTFKTRCLVRLIGRYW